MARYEVMGADDAMLGEASASADVLFQLGLMYSTGSTVPTDYVSAHKWFNLAAMRGNSRMRPACAARSPSRCRKSRSRPRSAPPVIGSSTDRSPPVGGERSPRIL